MLNYIRKLFKKSDTAQPQKAVEFFVPKKFEPTRMTFTIPVNGMSDAARAEIAELISEYKEEVKFNEKDGTIELLKRDIWIPVKNTTENNDEIRTDNK